ncbi:hypothetical protein ACFRQM_28680 [Streptomyces sp. NPDC056831]|uniref:hypothetical protein n=1 Tax=Streptomyces sp. NPDC056831 TaxID=3345954 RepID=UPI00369CC802
MEAGEEPISPAMHCLCELVPSRSDALPATITTALGHTGPHQSHRLLNRAAHTHRTRTSHHPELR